MWGTLASVSMLLTTVGLDARGDEIGLRLAAAIELALHVLAFARERPLRFVAEALLAFLAERFRLVERDDDHRILTAYVRVFEAVHAEVERLRGELRHALLDLVAIERAAPRGKLFADPVRARAVLNALDLAEAVRAVRLEAIVARYAHHARVAARAIVLACVRHARLFARALRVGLPMALVDRRPRVARFFRRLEREAPEVDAVRLHPRSRAHPEHQHDAGGCLREKDPTEGSVAVTHDGSIPPGGHRV